VELLIPILQKTAPTVVLRFLDLKTDLIHSSKDDDITGRIMVIHEEEVAVLGFSS
jgi:hypothetical protein